MRWFGVALVLAFALPLTPRPAAAADAAGLAAARASLADAVSRADAADIQRARAAFMALQADDPGSPALAYWIALCCWRAEPIVYPNDRDAARKLCKDGIAQCDRAFAADPRFGEALALKASLQGLAISFVPSGAMSLSAEMDEGFARATSLDPKNPRIAFMRALITLHKPLNVGGGPERAKPQFERALALYAAAGDAPGRQGIAWGRDDALLWSGRCLGMLGDWAGARARYREALSLNPAHRWVKDVLLPEADKHLAAPEAAK